MRAFRRIVARTLFFAAALSAATLDAQKPRGIEVSGLPALNFDADEGFGYGVILALYAYDASSTTYRWTVQPTVFLTTEGRRDYTLFFDAPSRADRPWRTTLFAGHEQQLAAPYYGLGNATDYQSAIEQGSTRYFYRYGRIRDRVSLDLQHSLGNPSLRLLVGAGVSNDKINLTPFDSGTTLIQHDLNNVTPANGHTNYLRAGLTWDTRDREIGTLSGTWADVIVQRVDKSLGASTSYTRWTATARHYQPLTGRLTLANRLLVQNVAGDAPFYVLGEVQGAQKAQDGLGGASTCAGCRRTATSARESSSRTTSFAGVPRTSRCVGASRRSCSAGSSTRAVCGPTGSTCRRRSTICTPDTAAARASGSVRASSWRSTSDTRRSRRRRCTSDSDICSDRVATR